jgi:hypothetical protein
MCREAIDTLSLKAFFKNDVYPAAAAGDLLLSRVATPSAAKRRCWATMVALRMHAAE